MNATIETSEGAIRGLGTDVQTFKGIPYGDDTSGTSRFQPPHRPRPWSGVRECFQYGNSCPQMTVEEMLGVPSYPETEQMMGVHNYERRTGEDCLVLNVWTPTASPTDRLPVLVWLHGGGWSTGSASWPLYEFDNLARQGNVVVGLNHRVGILGFLELSEMGDEFQDSGNAGMLDVVAALEWIRENIAGFGGDPGNVTVFGESGGGAKVSALLAMPSARGLFHKAVAMSGSMLYGLPREQAVNNARAALTQLGVAASAAELRAIEVSRLVEAEVAVLGGDLLGRGVGFGSTLGPSLPDHPVDALRRGLSRDVTLVSGCNSDEMIAFFATDPDMWTLDEAGLLRRVEAMVGNVGPQLLERYKRTYPGDSATSLFIGIATDCRFRVPQIRLAEAHIEGGGSATYMYLYRWGFLDPTGRMRSPHGVDMPFFFDNLDKAPAVAQDSDAERLLSMMGGVLTALGKTNAPGHGGLPDWPSYTLGERATMCLAVPPMVENDPLGEGLKCWEGMTLGGCPLWVPELALDTPFG